MTWTMEHVNYPILANQIPRREKDKLECEKGMWAAVITEAIQCYQGRAECKGDYQQDEKREKERVNAKRWFASGNTNPGTFLWICRRLKLKPCTIREKLDDMPMLTLHRTYNKKKT
jgi:hypothetical protein